MPPPPTHPRLPGVPVNRRQLLRVTVCATALSLALALALFPSRATEAAAHTTSPRQGDVRPLAEGETVEREIKGGEAHQFSVPLKANQYASLAVRRQGIDLHVTVSAPNQQVTKFTNPAGAQSPIFLSLMSETPVTYTVQVSPAEKWLAAGRYEISLSQARTPDPADAKRIEAQQLVAEGRLLHLAGTKDSYAAALVNYEKALTLWEEVGDRFEQANALHFIGRTYQALEDYGKAEGSYRRALAIRGDEDKGRGYTLFDLAEAYYFLKSRPESLPYYEEAKAAFMADRDTRGQALALSQIGLVYMRRNDWKTARIVLEEALRIHRAEGDTHEEMRALNMMGGVYDYEGQPEKALESFTRARDGFHLLGDLAREGNLSINIGLRYDEWSEWREALTNYQTALASFAEAGALPESDKIYIKGKRASALYNIGAHYVFLGDYAEGLKHLQKSLDLRAEPERGHTLMMMGYAHVLSNEPKTALEYCETARKIQEDAKDPDVAQTYMVMGVAYDAQGDRQKAVEYFDKALEIQQNEKTLDLKNQAITLDWRGRTHAAMGNAGKALEDLEAALSVWQKYKDRNGEAMAHFQLARVERDRLHLDAALSHAEAAVKLTEPLRASVMSQQLRATYFAPKVDYYDLYIDLNMRAGGRDATRVAVAFEASERTRGRGLLDLLSDAGVDAILSDAELAAAGPEQQSLAALAQKRRSLQRTILTKSAQRERALMKKPGAGDAATLEGELAALGAEQERVEAQIRREHPRYAALMFPQPLSVAEVQRLLDPDTLLLEFFLGEEASYVWAVTPTSINGYTLPPRREIKVAARRLKELLWKGKPLPNESAAVRHARLKSASEEYWREALSLSRTLLGPVAAQFKDKRLLVVADGELMYLPFGALPSPEAAAALAQRVGATPAPLIRDHIVVNLPSASVLSALRQTARRAPVPKSVAIFADPVFEEDDPRLRNARAARPPAAPAGRLAELKLSRLPFTRQEASHIVEAAPRGSALTVMDFDANRERATDSQLGRYSIVHFATHGILDEEHPELSRLVLSLYDREGRFHEEGFLSLGDIYGLSLPVDLVVLSACRTGLGKEVRGEGLIGLTRGFMYAGSPRVVASLWQVDDEATAELMRYFYLKMFKEGMSPAAALRAAQLSVAGQRRWSSPYYWAGFVLQGEWR